MDRTHRRPDQGSELPRGRKGGRPGPRSRPGKRTALAKARRLRRLRPGRWTGAEEERPRGTGARGSKTRTNPDPSRAPRWEDGIPAPEPVAPDPAETKNSFFFLATRVTVIQRRHHETAPSSRRADEAFGLRGRIAARLDSIAARLDASLTSTAPPRRMLGRKGDRILLDSVLELEDFLGAEAVKGARLALSKRLRLPITPALAFATFLAALAWWHGCVFVGVR